jgi:arginine decarboxylase
MKTRYIDLIEQTFDFPKDEFKLADHKLIWNDLPLTELLEKHGSPLRITYLPKIGEKIDLARASFNKAIQDHGTVASTSTSTAPRATTSATSSTRCCPRA